jgi:hypothetical protein
MSKCQKQDCEEPARPRGKYCMGHKKGEHARRLIACRMPNHLLTFAKNMEAERVVKSPVVRSRLYHLLTFAKNMEAERVVKSPIASRRPDHQLTFA